MKEARWIRAAMCSDETTVITRAGWSSRFESCLTSPNKHIKRGNCIKHPTLMPQQPHAKHTHTHTLSSCMYKWHYLFFYPEKKLCATCSNRNCRLRCCRREPALWSWRCPHMLPQNRTTWNTLSSRRMLLSVAPWKLLHVNVNCDASECF